MAGALSVGADRGADRITRVLGWALDAHLRRIASTIRPVGENEARERVRTLAEQLSHRRVMLFYWIEDALPLMLGAQLADDLLRREIAFIRDETMGGRITAGILERSGRPALRLRRSPPAARVRDLQRVIRQPGWIGIAVDGHGPYRHVGQGFARLALRCEALAVPLAARVDRQWTVRIGAALRVPRRGAALTVRIGEPIVCRGAAGPLRAQLQEALDEVGTAADGALRARAFRAATAS